MLTCMNSQSTKNNISIYMSQPNYFPATQKFIKIGWWIWHMRQEIHILRLFTDERYCSLWRICDLRNSSPMWSNVSEGFVNSIPHASLGIKWINSLSSARCKIGHWFKLYGSPRQPATCKKSKNWRGNKDDVDSQGISALVLSPFLCHRQNGWTSPSHSDWGRAWAEHRAKYS